MDNITMLIRAILRILGGSHPVRLVIGILIGLALDMIRVYLIAIYGETIKAIAALGVIPPAYMIVLGILLSFSPFLVRRRVIPESAKRIFDILDEYAARVGMTRVQKISLYQPYLKKLEAEFSSTVVVDLSELAHDTVDEAKKGESAKEAQS